MASSGADCLSSFTGVAYANKGHTLIHTQTCSQTQIFSQTYTQTNTQIGRHTHNHTFHIILCIPVSHIWALSVYHQGGTINLCSLEKSGVDIQSNGCQPGFAYRPISKNVHHLYPIKAMNMHMRSSIIYLVTTTDHTADICLFSTNICLFSLLFSIT